MINPLQKAYRVLVVDDHDVVRRGVRSLLESQPGVEVCSEASNGYEALENVKRDKPNLVVLDLTMPEMNGLEAARAIREAAPESDVLILSMHFSEEIAREVLRVGARGYVLKSDANTELLIAVQRLRQGKSFFTSRLATSMTDIFVNGPSDSSNKGLLPGTPLTNRELEIVQLLAEGKSNKETAGALGVSTRTIESHRNHIMRKMGFTSFSDLVRFAIRNSLVEP
ncbi:MAG: response regulator [Candidatus Acidiferrales bacterium]